jgi:hypothetical protein
MVEPHTEERIPIEEVRSGYSLAVTTPEGRRLFQVGNVTWLYKPASGGPVYTLTSKPTEACTVGSMKGDTVTCQPATTDTSDAATGT